MKIIKYSWSKLKYDKKKYFWFWSVIFDHVTDGQIFFKLYSIIFTRGLRVLDLSYNDSFWVIVN